jgi:putative lipoprotein (rSAM/lipoprotein system)
MQDKIFRIKDFLYRKALKITGTIFGFGTISLFIMCKYGDFIDYSIIRGKVTSSKSGLAIPNIQVSDYISGDSVKTNTNGEYEIINIFPGENKLKAVDIDGTQNGEFQTSEKTIQVGHSEIANCDFILDPK